MSFLSSLTDALTAARKLVSAVGRLFPSKQPDKPLVRPHFVVDEHGHGVCLYCRKPAPWPAGEACPKFH